MRFKSEPSTEITAAGTGEMGKICYFSIKTYNSIATKPCLPEENNGHHHQNERRDA